MNGPPVAGPGDALTPAEIEALRARTPGCAHRVHLNNAGAGLMSAATVDAVTGHLRREAEIGGYEAEDAAAEELERTYGALAELVGGGADEIALFDNSTHAWNAAFYSVPLTADSRIVTGRAEYGSNISAIWQRARRAGCEVVIVPDDETGQVDLEALADAIDERTAAVALAWIPTGNGLVNPAAAVGELLAGSEALFLLDATQAVGQLQIDVAQIGCDVLTGTGRKWLRGPRGTGFSWTRAAALERLDPHVADLRSTVWDGAHGFTWVGGARRFETWEASYANQLGLGTAVREALALGVARGGERSLTLASRLRERLGEHPRITVHDRGTEQCAIVTVGIDGHPTAAVAAELASHGINVSTTEAAHNQLDTLAGRVHPLVRLSPHYYNTEDEVDQAVAVLTALADR